MNFMLLPKYPTFNADENKSRNGQRKTIGVVTSTSVWHKRFDFVSGNACHMSRGSVDKKFILPAGLAR